MCRYRLTSAGLVSNYFGTDLTPRFAGRAIKRTTSSSLSRFPARNSIAGRIPRNRTVMWVAPLNADLLRSALAQPANEGSNAMPPTDLNVPFHEKDDAKRLGARWDAARKTWFLPDYTETAPFTKWLPRHSDANLRCTSYFIAQSVRTCWHCDRDSHVFSFLLPRGHQTRQESNGLAHWRPQESEAIIYYITQIPEGVQARMRSLTGH
jgi:hypothetical protein